MAGATAYKTNLVYKDMGMVGNDVAFGRNYIYAVSGFKATGGFTLYRRKYTSNAWFKMRKGLKTIAADEFGRIFGCTSSQELWFKSRVWERLKNR